MALSKAVISLIVIGVVFLLIAIGLIFFACWYFRRKLEKKRDKNDAFFIPKSLDEPVVHTVRLQNGFPQQNGGHNTLNRGHASNVYSIDQTLTGPSTHKPSTGRRDRTSNPLFPPKKRGHDSADHVRSIGHLGYPDNQGYQSSRRGTPVYVTKHEERRHGNRGRKVDRNWNLKPNPQQHRNQRPQQQRLQKLDQYRPVDIDFPPEHLLERHGRDVIATNEGFSVDDVDGKALYLRWSPSVAKRRKESAVSRTESRGGRDFGGWDGGEVREWREGPERPPSAGSFKIATNTLPMHRNNKTALPSPIHAGNTTHFTHKTQL